MYFIGRPNKRLPKMKTINPDISEDKAENAETAGNRVKSLPDNLINFVENEITKFFRIVLRTFSGEKIAPKKADGDVFTALYRRYSGKILGYLYRYIGDYQKAEDLTIQTFMNAYGRVQEYKEMGQVLPWLYRIATDCAKVQAGSSPRKNEISPDTPAGGESGEAKSKEFIYKIISKMDSEYKDVLLLCDVEGLSYDDAAKILKTTETNVGTRVMRARKMLHDILRKHKYIF